MGLITMIKNNKGFTIIELMIASVAFATLIILITVAVMQVARVYYKGINTGNTENVTRNIVQYASKSIQFSNSVLVSTNNTSVAGSKIGWTCIGNQTYIYSEGSALSATSASWPNNVGLVYLTTNSCPSSSTLSNLINRGQELLGLNMRLTNFQISNVSNRLYNINVEVAFGNASSLCDSSISPISGSGGCNSNIAPNFFPNSNIVCKAQIGDQYCAEATLSTSVLSE